MSIEGQAASPRPFDGALPAEIGFLAGRGVDPGLLSRAAEGAREAGVSADEALLRTGLLDPGLYYRLLAAELGLPFLDQPLAVDPRARYPGNLLDGIAPLDPGRHEAGFAIAPRAAQVSGLLARRGSLPPGLAVTTPGRLAEGVFAVQGRPIASRAANALPDALPRQSFRDGLELRQVLAVLVGLAVLLAGAMALPVVTAAGASLTVASLFLGLVTLRLAAASTRSPVRPRAPPPRLPDAHVPVYTIIVPLYREGRVLERLVAALRALDYPDLGSNCTKR